MTVIRHGFDIGGVLSKYPDILRSTVLALLAAPGIEVHVLTDMPDHAKAVDMVRRNGFPVPPERIHSCDYDQFGEECKAAKARELDLHILWDDFVGYVATVGAPPIRLLVMPDPTRDYYHESWETDGGEDNFGRRMQRRRTGRESA